MIDTENQCVEINMSYFCKIVIFYTDFLIVLSHFFLAGSFFLHQLKKPKKTKLCCFLGLFYFISLRRSIRYPHHTQLLKSLHPLESKGKLLKAPYLHGHSLQCLERGGSRALPHLLPVLSLDAAGKLRFQRFVRHNLYGAGRRFRGFPSVAGK